MCAVSGIQVQVIQERIQMKTCNASKLWGWLIMKGCRLQGSCVSTANMDYLSICSSCFKSSFRIVHTCTCLLRCLLVFGFFVVCF